MASPPHSESHCRNSLASSGLPAGEAWSPPRGMSHGQQGTNTEPRVACSKKGRGEGARDEADPEDEALGVYEVGAGPAAQDVAGPGDFGEEVVPEPVLEVVEGVGGREELPDRDPGVVGARGEDCW